jgi:hypothetical protein
MLGVDLREVLFRQAVADAQIGVFRQEADVCQRVDFCPLEVSLVEPRLRKDVMHFQPGHSIVEGAERAPYRGFERPLRSPLVVGGDGRQRFE